VPRPAPTRSELLDLAWERVGATGPYDFVRKVGLGELGYQRYTRWRRGGPIRYEDAWKLLDALGWLRTDPTPLEAAEDLIRRLDAGERIPRRHRERVAVQVERVAEALPGVVARLRGVQADQQSP